MSKTKVEPAAGEIADGTTMKLTGDDDVLNVDCPKCSRRIVLLKRDIRALVKQTVEHDIQRAKEGLAQVQELVERKRTLSAEAKGLNTLRSDIRIRGRLEKIAAELSAMVKALAGKPKKSKGSVSTKRTR